jgi:hypothetical protein
MFTTGVLLIPDGGTGTSTSPTDGQLLIGNSTSSTYSLSTLTPGSGITLSNTSGAITVNTTGTGGLTQGSIVFSDGSGNPAQDNNRLFWDDTNFRLGIGTSTPQTALDIRGGDARFYSGSATNYLHLGVDGSGYPFIDAQTSHGLYFKMQTTARVHIGASGNLIIGDFTIGHFDVDPVNFLETPYMAYGTYIGVSPSRSDQIMGSGPILVNTTTQLGMLGIVSENSSTVTMIARGAASQTSDLQEWQDSSGTILAKVDSSGKHTSPVFNSTATQTIVSGSTSGSAVFSQPFAGSSYKKVIVYCSALLGTATYTFPTAFSNTPAVITTNQVGAAVATSLSTTAVTMTGATTTGYLIIGGY